MLNIYRFKVKCQWITSRLLISLVFLLEIVPKPGWSHFRGCRDHYLNLNVSCSQACERSKQKRKCMKETQSMTQSSTFISKFYWTPFQRSIIQQQIITRAVLYNSTFKNAFCHLERGQFLLDRKSVV